MEEEMCALPKKGTNAHSQILPEHTPVWNCFKTSLLEREREKRRETKNPKAVSPLSTGPYAGLASRIPRSRPELKSRVSHLTAWATQASISLFKILVVLTMLQKSKIKYGKNFLWFLTCVLNPKPQKNEKQWLRETYKTENKGSHSAAAGVGALMLTGCIWGPEALIWDRKSCASLPARML